MPNLRVDRYQIDQSVPKQSSMPSELLGFYVDIYFSSKTEVTKRLFCIMGSCGPKVMTK